MVREPDGAVHVPSGFFSILTKDRRGPIMKGTRGGKRMAVEVRLPAFEGPLDLLLHLIEKNQVDIYDIPVYEITQQYLACLDEWNKKNMEIASEFIVMAATLINIKAKMLLPVQKEEAEEAEDPREELIRRLLEYKRYKEAAGELRERFPDPTRLWLCRGMEKLQLPPQIPPIAQLLAGMVPEDLYALYERAVRSQKESIDPLRSTFRSVAKDSYTIEEKIQDLMRTLDALQSVSFYSLREKSRSRQEEITYFLAMLELNRSSLVYLQQKQQFADIIMSPRRDSGELPEAAADREEPAYPQAYVPIPEETAPGEPEKAESEERTPVLEETKSEEPEQEAEPVPVVEIQLEQENEMEAQAPPEPRQEAEALPESRDASHRILFPPAVLLVPQEIGDEQDGAEGEPEPKKEYAASA